MSINICDEMQAQICLICISSIIIYTAFSISSKEIN